MRETVKVHSNRACCAGCCMYEEIFQTAKRCAELAVTRCREFSKSTFQSERKVDKTWVTEADQKIELELRALIQNAHPEHSILGEEFGGVSEFEDNKFHWILDPIDGTFSFVHGIPFYSSLIAVLHGKTPVVGFACLPEMNIVMSAMKGKGAFINDVPYKKPARVGSQAIELIATADPYRFRMEGKERALEFLNSPERKTRTYPDALGYYLLLNGSVRAFVDPKVEVWDVAPFHCILPEAGFLIRPWHGKQSLERGTSVAFAVDEKKSPVACSEILDALKIID